MYVAHYQIPINMENQMTVITIQDAINNRQDGDRMRELKRISCVGRYENHQLILQYSDEFPFETLYAPDIRASIDNNWVLVQKVL